MNRENLYKSYSDWWIQLKENKGGQAQLKRCGTPEEAALHPETYRLRTLLPPWIPIEGIATLSGVSSHIKNDTHCDFGKSLAAPKEKNGKPPLSESRFRQLLSSRDWDELYRSLRRAVIILDGNVGLDSFFETLLLWNENFQESYRRPGKSIKFKLSQEYYQETIKHDK